ncbi:hypothetical protein CVU83_02310 [Candidatus Falkowbacteria bacterium HGW-Falkowbacteria-2]|uniref:Uncharacterized protein n=1 Tax=Candidatus Falkowbacteria bacterium HGW-Falkowbacteria-2 TaxID=2013769 RepID=A0A2N2DZY4_9BACT|nr:MAG: hypothetical protein CVU83_02310 [Candidatus Falkowbacteria bacterium HGW-Falkowbacteria-2]
MGFENQALDNSFINQPKTAETMEKSTKEEAQQELIEKFGLRKTSDFLLALQQGKIELAEEWLNYIVENKDSFPQYESTWDSWLSDRQKDIEVYKNLKNDGSLEKMEHRTKEEAQQELIEKFGMRKTSDFQLALKQGKIELAEEWLNYVINNKMRFPQYIPTWDSWLKDRQNELAEAKG